MIQLLNKYYINRCHLYNYADILSDIDSTHSSFEEKLQ